MKLNNLSFAAFTLIFIGMLAFSCKSTAPKSEMKSGVEYYRNLQFTEGPFEIEKGTHQITPEEAKNINSYKFTYDNSGKLLSVEFVRNDLLLDYSSMQGAAKITYEYKDGKVYKEKHNGGIEIKEYIYKNNRLIEIVEREARKRNYSYDENGKLILEIVKEFSVYSSTASHIIKYVY